MNEPEKIISEIARQTKIMMQNHWGDIDEFRDGEEKIKVGFSHHITYQSGERIVETTISFGKRMKDTIVERIDIEQMKLDLPEKDLEIPPAAPIPIPFQAPAKRRGRPPGSSKKNILEKILTSGPRPDAA